MTRSHLVTVLKKLIFIHLGKCLIPMETFGLIVFQPQSGKIIKCALVARKLLENVGQNDQCI